MHSAGCSEEAEAEAKEDCRRITAEQVGVHSGWQLRVLPLSPRDSSASEMVSVAKRRL